MTRRVLVVDVGGTYVKVHLPGSDRVVSVTSGRSLTPRRLVVAVKKAARGCPHDTISLGLPTVVVDGRVTLQPTSLGPGLVGFDFAKAFGKPVRVINDAAMQALGSYEGGTMFFLGLGTGMGAALVKNGVAVPLEFGMLPYRRGTCESYLGDEGFTRFPRWKWREHVRRITAILKEATVADYVVIGGGRAAALQAMPPGCRRGDNRNARRGGEVLWDGAGRDRHHP